MPERNPDTTYTPGVVEIRLDFRPMIAALKRMNQSMKTLVKSPGFQQLAKMARIERDRKEIQRIADRERLIAQRYLEARMVTMYAEFGLVRS